MFASRSFVLEICIQTSSHWEIVQEKRRGLDFLIMSLQIFQTLYGPLLKHVLENI